MMHTAVCHTKGNEKVKEFLNLPWVNWGTRKAHWLMEDGSSPGQIFYVLPPRIY